MAAVVQAGLAQDLAELTQRARARYDLMTPSQKLRHRYMQRRSFAKSFGKVDRMPHEATLSDAQIGLILLGEPKW